MKSQCWIDFETGGFNALVHSPLSMGAIAIVGGKIVDRLYCEFRIPPLVVTQEALAINKQNLIKAGITTKKEFQTIWKNFCNMNFYQNGNVRPNKDNMPLFCGQNTFFDRPFLRELMESDFDMVYYHRIDIMVLASVLREEGMLPGIENVKQETMSNYFRLPPQKEAHHALYDIERAIEIYGCLKRIMRGEKIDSIRGLMDDQPELNFNTPHFSIGI